MRILCLADLHGVLPDVRRLPQADFALIAGDLTPMGAVSQHQEIDLQAQWVRDHLSPWVSKLSKRMPSIAIAGNHDFLATFPHGERLLRSLDWIYLRDQSVNVAGLEIFGSPWTPRHPRYPLWAFQAEDAALKRHWLKIPRSTDVLLCHGPPQGSRDLVHGNIHAGSLTLEAWRQRTVELTGRGPLIVCGHLHEDPGYSPGTQVALGSIVHPGGSQPRGRVLIMEGQPGAWKGKLVAAPMGTDAQWFDNLTVEEHIERLHAERVA